MKAVYGIEFREGADVLLAIEQNRNRRYVLPRPVEYSVFTDAGTLIVRTEAGFVFDGRSGPSIVDFYVPNLGSLGERVAWHMHDCLGYAQSLDFHDTNLILQLLLRDECGYWKVKSLIIRGAVSSSMSWYVWPNDDDEWACNRGKVTTRWIPYAA